MQQFNTSNEIETYVEMSFRLGFGKLGYTHFDFISVMKVI